jgi:predicted SprT family Zn-dependent metalloprotease
MMAFTSPETWSAQTLAGTTVEQVVAHEFAHVVVNHLGGGMAPKWLNEGIAP